MATPIVNPIINSPYREPEHYWELDESGQPTGEKAAGRRPSDSYMPVPRARKGSKLAAQQRELFGFDQILEDKLSNTTISAIRTLVRDWRNSGYPNVTPTTRRLLEYWTRESRGRRLFFAQLEAVETAIYLVEIGTKLGKGWVGEQVVAANAQYNAGLPRVALKMATGTGKTVVMAMLIAWQVLNKTASPQDARFTRKFLIVAPGITIRDRLRVLMPSDPNGGYYQEMDLVPSDLRPALGQARIAITNFHNFQLKATREGEGVAATTKKLLLGGRSGSKREDPFVETPAQMVNRVLRDLGGGDKSQIIVINDEAHHCYQTRGAALAATADAGETEDQLSGEARKQAKENNDNGRLWFDGLKHIMGKVGIKQVYDLSATPSYLTGSGYREGLLFPWVVSDFGLLDAIESGLVKIPRVPVDDNATQAQVSYLNLWSSIPDPERERMAKGGLTAHDPLPAVVDGALRNLYQDYERAYNRWEGARKPNDGSTPPVFIVVCANTKISKLVYDKIAGFDVEGAETAFPGMLPLFSNYDERGRTLEKPRTIIVDSVQLESEEAKLTPEFLNATKKEREVFHREFVTRNPGRSADELTDKDLLREVLNTVGKAGKLGQDVRCVVSVSMLTEGWDANTVTHILGIRAFNSHLLCEQVVGRGLRRVSYDVNADERLEPEYAEVYGIPFQFIQTDPDKVLEVKPRPVPVHVHAVPERTAQRIVFPRLDGYRVEIEELPGDRVDFSGQPAFVVDDAFASQVDAESVFGTVKQLDSDDPERPVRAQEVAFLLAKDLMRKIQDPTGAQKPWLFPKLVAVAKEWISACVTVDARKTLVALATIDVERKRAVEQLELAFEWNLGTNTSPARMLPIFQRFAPEGSTDAVDFFTTKPRYEADPDKCPVNYVVLDGAGDGNRWERAMAELLELLPEVDAYVKNDHLEFRVPYSYAGRAHWYLPDFIVRLKKPHEEDVTRHLIIEVSGTLKHQRRAMIKAQVTVTQWCAAVNNHSGYGVWGFVEVDDPLRFRSDVGQAITRLYGGEATITGQSCRASDFVAQGIVEP